MRSPDQPVDPLSNFDGSTQGDVPAATGTESSSLLARLRSFGAGVLALIGDLDTALKTPMGNIDMADPEITEQPGTRVLRTAEEIRQIVGSGEGVIIYPFK